MKSEVNKEYTAHLVLAVQLKEQLREPNFYQVMMHNDDFTPMEFVVEVLEKFFYMSRRKAIEIMLEVHVKGKAMCGLYVKDVAESKVAQIIKHARVHEHPLVCSTEAAS